MYRIKKLLSNNSKQRIYNKDIAKALDLTPEYFAVIKKREKIPYEAIATFCRQREISINWILLGQGSKELCPEEEKYLS
jgi:hypothetical protein